jgi:hypothetical protein
MEMKSSHRPVGVSVAFALAGAVTGWLGVTTAMPLIRQVDPFGLWVVVLISVMGGIALGWYLRGRAELGAAPDPARR